MILQVLNENSNFFGYGNIDVQATNRGYDGEAGCYRILAESEQEWGKLTLAMANAEVAAFLREDVVLLEAAGAGFLEKAKNFFLKLWAKVKELFNKFIAFIQTHTVNDEKFLKKYETRINMIRTNISNKFKYKMIPWKWSSITNNSKASTTGIVKKLDEIISNFNSKLDGSNNVENYDKDKNDSDTRESEANKYRGIFLTGDNTNKSEIEADEFREEILRKCCGDEDPEPEEKDGNEIEWSELIDIVRNGKRTIDDMKKSKDNMDIMFKKILSQLQKSYNTFTKNDVKGEKDFKQVRKISKINTNNNDTNYESIWKDPKNKSNAQVFNKSYTNSTSYTKYDDNTFGEKSSTNYEKNITNTQGHLSNYITQIKTASSIAVEGYGVYLDVAKKCKAQARNILNKAIVATSNGQMTNESVSYNNILDMFMQ